MFESSWSENLEFVPEEIGKRVIWTHPYYNWNKNNLKKTEINRINFSFIKNL